MNPEAFNMYGKAVHTQKYVKNAAKTRKKVLKNALKTA